MTIDTVCLDMRTQSGLVKDYLIGTAGLAILASTFFGPKKIQTGITFLSATPGIQKYIYF